MRRHRALPVARIVALLLVPISAMLVPSDTPSEGAALPILACIAALLASFFVLVWGTLDTEGADELSHTRFVAALLGSAVTCGAWGRGASLEALKFFVPTLAVVTSLLWQRGPHRSLPLARSFRWSRATGALLFTASGLFLLGASLPSPWPFVLTLLASTLIGAALVLQVVSRLRADGGDLVSPTARAAFGNTIATATFLAYVIVPLFAGTGWTWSLLALPPALLGWNVVRGRVWHVGTDAVVGRALLGNVVIALDDIQHAEQRRTCLCLHLKNGKTVELPRDRALWGAIEDAVSDAQHAPTVEALARNQRGVASWREELTRRAERPEGYRGAALDTGALHAVLDSGASRPEQRIGAALALGARRDPDVGPKLRVAAARTANPKLAAVFEDLADGDADDADIERALASASRGRSSAAR